MTSVARALYDALASVWCSTPLATKPLFRSEQIVSCGVVPSHCKAYILTRFISYLDQFHKTLLLLGCLCLPFDNTTVTAINKFIASAVANVYKSGTENLRELEASWLLK